MPKSLKIMVFTACADRWECWCGAGFGPYLQGFCPKPILQPLLVGVPKGMPTSSRIRWSARVSTERSSSRSTSKSQPRRDSVSGDVSLSKLRSSNSLFLLMMRWRSSYTFGENSLMITNAFMRCCGGRCSNGMASALRGCRGGFDGKISYS